MRHAGTGAPGTLTGVSGSTTLPQRQVATMPAKSKAQQKAAGAALSAKRGETDKKDLKGASTGMVDSMTEKELHDLASTDRKALPDKKQK